MSTYNDLQVIIDALSNAIDNYLMYRKDPVLDALYKAKEEAKKALKLQEEKELDCL